MAVDAGGWFLFAGRDFASVAALTFQAALCFNRQPETF